MERRKFIKFLGLTAFAVSTTGFKLIEENDMISTNCATSSDMLGPFFRKNAPKRNDLTYKGNKSEIPLKVVGQVFGNDCTTPLSNIELDVWHCDHRRRYDMKSDKFRCRGKLFTNENGEYWFKTFVPPPYQGRPKHIHYLIHESARHQELITQLYFRGDNKIKKKNWMKYPWDEKRILDIYKNKDKMPEVRLDLYLKLKENLK